MSEMVTMQMARDMIAGADQVKAHLIARDGGYVIEITLKEERRTIRTARRENRPRVFKTFEAAAITLRNLGIENVDVDLHDYGALQQSLI